jgi:heme oxygenase
MSTSAKSPAATHPSPRLSQALRLATRPLHERLEAALPLMQPTLTCAHYRAHIAALWPCVQATEAVIAPFMAQVGAWCGDPQATHVRSHLLQADAQSLGVTPRAPVSHHLAQEATLPQVVGCWYVLGGSRIGGQLICRQLSKVLGPDVVLGLTYYSACSAADARAFKRFLGAIDEREDLRRSQGQAIQAALATFRLWSHYLMAPP